MIQSPHAKAILAILSLTFLVMACGQTTFKPIQQLINPQTQNAQTPAGTDENDGDTNSDHEFQLPDGLSDLSRLHELADPEKPENKQVAEKVHDIKLKDVDDTLELGIDVMENGTSKHLIFKLPKNELNSDYSQVFKPEDDGQTAGSQWQLKANCNDDQNCSKEMGLVLTQTDASGKAQGEVAILRRERDLKLDVSVPTKASLTSTKQQLIDKIGHIPNWVIDTTYIGGISHIQITDANGTACFKGKLKDKKDVNISDVDENSEEFDKLSNCSSDDKYKNLIATVIGFVPESNGSELLLSIEEPLMPSISTGPNAAPTQQPQLATKIFAVASTRVTVESASTPEAVLPEITIAPQDGSVPVFDLTDDSKNALVDTLGTLRELATFEDVRLTVNKIKNSKVERENLGKLFSNMLRRKDEILAAFLNKDISDVSKGIIYINGPESPLYFTDGNWPVQISTAIMAKSCNNGTWICADPEKYCGRTTYFNGRPFKTFKEANSSCSDAYGPMQMLTSTASNDSTDLIVYEASFRGGREYVNKCDQRRNLYYSMVGAARVWKDYFLALKPKVEELGIPMSPMFAYFGYRFGPYGTRAKTLLKIIDNLKEQMDGGIPFWQAARYIDDYRYFKKIVAIQIISLNPEAYGITITHDPTPVDESVIKNGYCPEDTSKHKKPILDLIEALTLQRHQKGAPSA